MSLLLYNSFPITLQEYLSLEDEQTLDLKFENGRGLLKHHDPEINLPFVLMPSDLNMICSKYDEVSQEPMVNKDVYLLHCSTV